MVIDVDMAWLHLKVTTDKSTTLVSIPLHGHVQAHLHLGTGKYMYIIAVTEQIQWHQKVEGGVDGSWAFLWLWIDVVEWVYFIL